MFMLHIGSYEKARNLARKAEDTSNIDTEDDNVQQRNRRPPTRYSDSTPSTNEVRTIYMYGPHRRH